MTEAKQLCVKPFTHFSGRISHDRNDIHEPAPEFTIVSSDVSDANSNALTNVSNDEVSMKPPRPTP